MPRLQYIKPRALPLAIFAMAGLMLLKGAHLVQAAGGVPAAISSAGRSMIPPAQAASPASPHQQAPARQAATPPSAASEPAAASAPVAEPPVDEAERALLLDLRARRAVLETREQAIATREATQAAAERRLNERVTQLTALQAQLEKLDETRRERDDSNWRGLVKTYEAMRPREAAIILNELDSAVLLQVLDRMKEAKAALVLAAMQPDRARNATAALAQLRSRSVAAPTLGGAPTALEAPR